MKLVALDLPAGFSPFELAEWIEAFMIINGLDSLSRSAISNTFPAGQGPDGAELDESFGEVRRRADVSPNFYPFRASKEGVTRAADVDGASYDFLDVLAIEAAPFRKDGRYNEIGPFFELLVREALISYMGGGFAVRFGWPGDGRPEMLADAVAWIATHMALPIGNVSEIDVAEKDGGVDVVGWKPFSDGQPSFATWLVQITVQATYERKGSDVNTLSWLPWILFGQPPGTGLAIPYALPHDAQVRLKLKREVGLLLDRLRLAEMLKNFSRSSFPELRSLESWTDQEIMLVRTALVTPSQPQPRMAKRRRSLRVAKAGAPGV